MGKKKLEEILGVEISNRYPPFSNGEGCNGSCSWKNSNYKMNRVLTVGRNPEYIKVCTNGRGNPRFTGRDFKELNLSGSNTCFVL